MKSDIDMEDVFTNQYSIIKDLQCLEDKLSTQERENLDSSQFGIPELRKYPLNDENHVRQAVIMFNYVDRVHEKELASNIIKAIRKYKLDIQVSNKNRLRKYMNNIQERDTMKDTSRKIIEAYTDAINEKKEMNVYTVSFIVVHKDDSVSRYQKEVPAYSEKQLFTYIKKTYCKSRSDLIRDFHVISCKEPDKEQEDEKPDKQSKKFRRRSNKRNDRDYQEMSLF